MYTNKVWCVIKDSVVQHNLQHICHLFQYSWNNLTMSKVTEKNHRINSHLYKFNKEIDNVFFILCDIFNCHHRQILPKLTNLQVIVNATTQNTTVG